MALKQLTLIQGNTQTYTITLMNGSAGTPYCLKNWVIYFTVKTDPSLPDAQASFQKKIISFSDSTGGTTGVAVIPVVPTDTINLPPQQYDFDIKVITAANENFTVMRGKLDLLYGVTGTIGTAGTAH